MSKHHTQRAWKRIQVPVQLSIVLQDQVLPPLPASQPNCAVVKILSYLVFRQKLLLFHYIAINISH